MVNVPGGSKGCTECRRRKVKCGKHSALPLTVALAKVARSGTADMWEMQEDWIKVWWVSTDIQGTIIDQSLTIPRPDIVQLHLVFYSDALWLSMAFH